MTNPPCIACPVKVAIKLKEVMRANIRKARPTCMKKKKKSTLAIECIDIPDDDDDLQIVYLYHPSGTFDRFDT